MKLREFECLRAIMTTGNMTQAAHSIGISQPSASSIISNLEYKIGFKLFERVKGRLVATPEAKHFLPDAVRTLDSMELAHQKAKQIKGNKFGDLKIASYPDIAIDFLPSVISRFLDGNQSIHIRLHARRSEMMSGLLPAQDFDLAIVTRVVEERNFNVQEIKLPCVFAMPKGHDLAGKTHVGPRNIGHLPLVVLTPDHPSVVQLFEKFTESKTSFQHGLIETQTFESAASFIRHGVGVGLLDPITATRYAGGGELEFTQFAPTVYQNIYLLLPADRPVSKLLQLFLKQFNSDLESCCKFLET